MSVPPPSPVGDEPLPNRPITVFVHVHYADVWRDMARLLAERLDVPFRLVVTSSLPVAQIDEPRKPFHRGTLVVPVENRGRDIRPFLIALGRVDDFDVGLKLHTKRSDHRLDGDDWREEILASLVPPEGVRAICQAFARRKDIGLIAPLGLFLPIRDWVLRNRRRMKLVSGVLEAGPDPRSFAEGYFSAGSMFWFNRDALAAFADPALLPLFERESGQTDGTTAHAIERLFALKAERDGFVALPMNALDALGADLPAGGLRELSRSRAEVVSPFFRKPRIVRLLARHAPWTLAVYRILPSDMRRKLRSSVVGQQGDTTGN